MVQFRAKVNLLPAEHIQIQTAYSDTDSICVAIWLLPSPPQVPLLAAEAGTGSGL